MQPTMIAQVLLHAEGIALKKSQESAQGKTDGL